MHYRKSRTWMWILYVIGSILLLASILVENSTYQTSAMLVGLVMVFAGIYLVISKWKCPYCGENLPLKDGKIGTCPFCQKKLPD